MATGMTPYEHEIKELQKLFQTEQARLTSLQRQIAECQFQLRYLQGKIDAYTEIRTKPSIPDPPSKLEVAVDWR
jgi:chromosome segregation ATPase